MSNNSIWPIDMILSGAAALGQSGLESNGNEGVLCVLQSTSITGASLADSFVPYPGHSLGRGSYPSAELQSEYSSALTGWADKVLCYFLKNCSWLNTK